MRFKLTIEYDGGPFSGWQRLPGGPSIQGSLEDAVEKLTGGARSEVIGAGRTDGLGHSREQDVAIRRVDLGGGRVIHQEPIEEERGAADALRRLHLAFKKEEAA